MSICPVDGRPCDCLADESDPDYRPCRGKAELARLRAELEIAHDSIQATTAAHSITGKRAEQAEAERDRLRALIKSMGNGFDDEAIDAALQPTAEQLPRVYIKDNGHYAVEGATKDPIGTLLNMRQPTAEQVREECLHLCDEKAKNWQSCLDHKLAASKDYVQGRINQAKELAAAIRAIDLNKIGGGR